MSQQEKGAYYRALKEAGVEFTKHYRDYSTADLETAYRALGDMAPPLETEQPAAPAPDPAAIGAAFDAFAHADTPPPPAPRQEISRPPVAEADPREMAGQRLNTRGVDEPIRSDDQGRIWYQEEVLKPAFPKPRGRRVLDYIDTGAKLVTAKNGDYTESFEVAGDEQGRTAQVKVTLPSYQVGIFKDPRLPFKTHVYNGKEGFDLFEVEDFWNGAELVPEGVKRIYVANVLCYDIRTVVRAINDEYRQLQLTGKVQ